MSGWPCGDRVRPAEGGQLREDVRDLFVEDGGASGVALGIRVSAAVGEVLQLVVE
ncbi:hypothetical protein [Rhodococcus ruber]|uniref:hypothetical protein n=1 Tax=Rhodococcus ruber TaxID=1830 RepID=UPI0037840647